MHACLKPFTSGLIFIDVVILSTHSSYKSGRDIKLFQYLSGGTSCIDFLVVRHANSLVRHPGTDMF